MRLPFREIRIALNRFLEEAVFAGGGWSGLFLSLRGVMGGVGVASELGSLALFSFLCQRWRVEARLGEWAFVAKRGKGVQLLDLLLTNSPSPSLPQRYCRGYY